MKIIDTHELDLIYPMRWACNYCQVNPLIRAAYPEMKVDTEAVMLHARTRAKLRQAIKLAEYLGLLYFGYQDVCARDTYSLQFIKQERLIDYLKQTIACLRVQNLSKNSSLVSLNQGDRAWFICTFWQQLLPLSVIRKTLKQGLVLADLEQALKHKEKRMTVLLGAELNTFDLIIDNSKTNVD